MNKLKLDLEALAVESFAVAEGVEERGTVRGRQADTIRDQSCALSCYYVGCTADWCTFRSGCCPPETQ